MKSAAAEKSLTAAVSFQPRTAKTACGKSFAEVKALLAAKSVLAGVTADDFKVRAKGTPADEAYHTEDLDDLLATGLLLAK